MELRFKFADNFISVVKGEIELVDGHQEIRNGIKSKIVICLNKYDTLQFADVSEFEMFLTKLSTIYNTIKI